MSRKTRDEQDGGDESTSSHPDFEKLSRYFDVGIIRKVNIREFDFLSSAVFIDDRLARRGSLCLIDNVLVLAPSYISGHFDDVRDVTPLCTSSKMLMKSTPRRKSLLSLSRAERERKIKSQELVEEEITELKQTEDHITTLPCHFCHRVANSKTRLCRNCGVSSATNTKKHS